MARAGGEMSAFQRLCLIVFLLSLGSEALAACGTRGGPGYRAADGKCVGWAELARKCGSPPDLRCTAENAQPEAAVAAQNGSTIRQFMRDAQDRSQRPLR